LTEFFIIFSYNCLYFCGGGGYFSSFICDFIYLSLFSFFLDKSGLRFINFMDFFPKAMENFFQ